MFNIAKLRQTQAALEKSISELQKKEFFHASLGVKVTVTGDGTLKDISFSDMSPERFVELKDDLSDIILSVYKEAHAQAEEERAKCMKGISLPNF